MHVDSATPIFKLGTLSDLEKQRFVCLALISGRIFMYFIQRMGCLRVWETYDT